MSLADKIVNAVNAVCVLAPEVVTSRTRDAAPCELLLLLRARARRGRGRGWVCFLTYTCLCVPVPVSVGSP